MGWSPEGARRRLSAFACPESTGCSLSRRAGALPSAGPGTWLPLEGAFCSPSSADSASAEPAFRMRTHVVPRIVIDEVGEMRQIAALQHMRAAERSHKIAPTGKPFGAVLFLPPN